jgi:poly-D-alanine transfer protein DltD
MARRQIDVWLLFGGLKKNKLEQVVRDCDTRLDYNDFEQVYRFCTDGKYSFMYLDCATDSYRKNFNEQILIT